jgi:hypothetical protein
MHAMPAGHVPCHDAERERSDAARQDCDFLQPLSLGWAIALALAAALVIYLSGDV